MDIATPLEQQIETSKSNIDAKIFQRVEIPENPLFSDCIQQLSCYDFSYHTNFRSDCRGACCK